MRYPLFVLLGGVAAPAGRERRLADVIPRVTAHVLQLSGDAAALTRQREAPDAVVGAADS